MKKTVLLLNTLLFMLFTAYGQNLQTDFLAQKQEKAGLMLVKTSQDILVSTSLLIAGTGILYLASTFDNNAENTPKPLLYSASGILYGAGVAFFIAHIIHLKQAGNYLQYNSKKKLVSKINITPNSNGVALTYHFK